MKDNPLKKTKLDLKFVYSDDKSIGIVFSDNNLLMGVVGEFNINLKELEKLTKQQYILEETQ